MFRWAGIASTLLRRPASPRADNSGSCVISIAGKELLKIKSRYAMGSPTVPRYLGRTTEYVATGEAGCFAHHEIATPTLSH
jgi:hypothetical protein